MIKLIRIFLTKFCYKILANYKDMFIQWAWMKEIHLFLNLFMLIISADFANLYYVMGRWGLRNKLEWVAMLLKEEWQVAIADALNSLKAVTSSVIRNYFTKANRWIVSSSLSSSILKKKDEIIIKCQLTGLERVWKSFVNEVRIWPIRKETTR